MTAIDSNLSEDRLFPVPEDYRVRSRLSDLGYYEKLYRESLEHPDTFWAKHAERELHWDKQWDTVCSYHPEYIGQEAKPYIQYFQGGKLNVAYNCLDRHVLSEKGERVAIHWQGEQEEDRRSLTYRQLYTEVLRFCDVLRAHGVGKGSVVSIFMPMVPELPVAMLACARLGALHSVVFSAFSAEALRSRIEDCGAEVLITADVGFHAGKIVPLKEKADQALSQCPSVQTCIVYKRGNGNVAMQEGRDYWWHEELESVPSRPASGYEALGSEQPLFILYTSGSTGKPKGVLHTSAGYLLYAHLTFKYVFDYHDRDVYFCTADIGWITGHSYVVYGPLSNAATIVMFEGVPTYPNPDRFWRIIEHFKVNIFYTAPTAIRALMRLGEEWPAKYDLSSLRLLGSVGEPINPEAWVWYHRAIGHTHCPVVDTWWQTETGGMMITALPGAMDLKPGSATKPFFGVAPQVLKDDGTPAGTNEGGSLCLAKPWPGMLRGVYGDAKHELIYQTYFSRFPGKYFTGDGCRVDEDGYYWLLGRIDDVINVSGHRLATAEIESALVSHKSVAEAAVVGMPHDLKGQGIYCFVTLKLDVQESDELRKALIQHVRTEISPIATPDIIQFAPSLPKTRSGKIMRRILRKIAEGEVGNIGDTSTLADPSVVEALVTAAKGIRI